MSLDVSLHLDTERPLPKTTGSGIFIRENGSTREISLEEWNERFPGREPVTVNYDDDYVSDVVFDWNITHNLNTMASEAGIYTHLWRPEEIGITHARDLIEPLRNGLAELQTYPEKYKVFNPENGWGDYEGLVEFVRQYLKAAIRYPEATISVSR